MRLSPHTAFHQMFVCIFVYYYSTIPEECSRAVPTTEWVRFSSRTRNSWWMTWMTHFPTFDLRPFLQLYYRAFIDSTSTFQHRFGSLLFFVHLIVFNAYAFPRSDNPIFAYAFRCLLWACRFGCACNTSWFFITLIFTQPHRLQFLITRHFCRAYV